MAEGLKAALEREGIRLDDRDRKAAQEVAKFLRASVARLKAASEAKDEPR